MAEPKLTTRQRRELLAMIGPNPLGAQGAGAFDPSRRVPVPAGQQLVIGPDGTVTYPGVPLPPSGSGRRGFFTAPMPITVEGGVPMPDPTGALPMPPGVTPAPIERLPALPPGLLPMPPGVTPAPAERLPALPAAGGRELPPSAFGIYEEPLPMPPGVTPAPAERLPSLPDNLARPESRVARSLLTGAPAPAAPAAPSAAGLSLGDRLSEAPRTAVPAGQQLQIDAQGNVTYPTPAAGTPAPTAPAPAAGTPAPVPNIPVLQRPTNAYTVGAPIADDATDRFGREMPGAQTFARKAFAASENAKKLLEDYKKANPTDKAGIAQREAAANQAAQFASQSNAWMALPSSTRARLITEGQVAADQTSAMERGRQQINEMRQDPNLFGVLRDYNETGVLRGGAGPGTATTDAGGVISAPDATGTRRLTSPYGTGSSRMLTPNEFANRPEAMIDGQPASKFFEDAALRQGRDITVGGVQYSGAGTQLAPGRTSYTPYDQKQVEGRRAFWEDEAKRNKEKGTPPIR